MALLRTIGISKAFPGVQALDSVSFELRAGEVHALIGENGAGKSTLIKILTGAEQPDRGRIELDGQALVDHDPLRARALGIAAIYQQPALFSQLTVAENIALGLEPGGPWRRIDRTARRRRARELLDRVGARIEPDARVETLSMPQQQLVEIARALGAEAKVLILDEPTACLPEQEVDNLFGVVRGLRDSGVGMIYISHRLAELFEVADRVTVLRDGATVATREMAHVEQSELIRLMVGRELSAVYPARQAAPGEVLLEVEGLTCRATGVRGVSLSVRAGEVVGLAGLVGAGRTELARLLFGLDRPDGGRVLLKGQPVDIGTPQAAIAHGIVYVPEDRRRHGVIGPLSTLHNTSLAVLRRLLRHGLVDRGAELELATDLATRLDVRTPSLYAPVANLSGGNQQKVALARWLAAEPQVVIVDEPTQGIDVAAKGEIHRLLNELAERGKGVLLISSELPEVLGMSDRVVVLHEGAVAGTLTRGEATQEKVLALALGHRAEEVAAR